METKPLVRGKICGIAALVAVRAGEVQDCQFLFLVAIR